ncbi:N-acyl homoserine lactonase family protein [Ktedonosporobacter rubrisoli]|uniref:N-acyl homoserine lactonase family protein n=1 Tax=Ktedonosporobacter rubrisoli TaxID=2509675 RepID=A0A4P6JKH2_KTERU|nr:N-acyl homoserine lactonase family protein [Ktedonosporobacter rubrisoli]QBD75654.1 N-acyl homoserine lactonase family protein [Ktedonosporobacter rubrisoli]
MSANPVSPQRLYLMRVATIDLGQFSIPVVCYLVQTTDGQNILIDTGFPRTDKTEETIVDAVGRELHIIYEKDVFAQLAMLGLQPSDIDLLICTHYDVDHAGNLAAFSNARLVVQRREHEAALAGIPRLAVTRSQWDQPLSRFQFVNGDVQLLPGLELIETRGHTPGHQVVLVTLPQTGLVLLAIDAVAIEQHFVPNRDTGPTDDNGEEAIASTRKLLDLVEQRRVSLVVFGHDTPQWARLKQLPDFYA